MGNASAGAPRADEPLLSRRLGRAAALPRLIQLDERGELTTAHLRLVAQSLGCSDRTVRRWLDTARATGRSEPRTRDRFTVTQEIRRLLVLWGGNASAVHRELVKRAAEDPALPEVPSLATLHRALRQDLTPGDRAGLAHGEADRRAFDVFGKRPDGHRNSAWEGDHKCVPVRVWVEDELEQPHVTWFIDCATKYILGVAATPHQPSADAVLAALRTALDRTGSFGPAGGLPDLVRVDRGKDFLSKPVASALGRHAVPVIDLPAYSPYLKGTIEALNDAVEEMLFVSMPRYTGRQTFPGGWQADPDEPALTFEAFVGLLLDWVHWWNTEHKPDKLEGRTPLQAWSADPTPVYDVPADQLAHFGLWDDGRVRTIGSQGIQWRKHHYIAAWMVGMGGIKVALRHLPHHDRSIEVFGLDGAYLGSAFLADQASEEQILEVRRTRTAKARQLRADMKAAARLRRERFKAATSATPPERLGALTAAEAEAELSQWPSAALGQADPGYMPPRPVPDGWAQPVQPGTTAPETDTTEESA